MVKMKKVFVMALALCLLVIAPTKSKAENFISVGADLALNIDGQSKPGPGIGVMGRIALSLMTDWDVVGRIGYIDRQEKDGVQGSILPILVGLKYDIASGLGAELMMGMNRMTLDSYEGKTGKGWEFGMMLGAYYELKGIQLGANIFVPALEEIGHLAGLMFTAGYHFGF
jgi:hypothetical protein